MINNPLLKYEASSEYIDLDRIKSTAEEYYRSGDFYCSEAIVKTIKDAFRLSVPDTVIAAASGFPVGMGEAGCTCGALAGEVMSLGWSSEARHQRIPKWTRP